MLAINTEKLTLLKPVADTKIRMALKHELIADM